MNDNSPIKPDFILIDTAIQPVGTLMPPTVRRQGDGRPAIEIVNQKLEDILHKKSNNILRINKSR